ncbi:unnamed protein product [Pleuronectes platessa]|uniref:Uncharacterized protein n=1 Tax=Pleuronectes platessa TaxID=8262 RepID=A0A9N7YFT1_PLEPL|nr:unnamed protein product [Pleuronectes platessa]
MQVGEDMVSNHQASGKRTTALPPQPQQSQLSDDPLPPTFAFSSAKLRILQFQLHVGHTLQQGCRGWMGTQGPGGKMEVWLEGTEQKELKRMFGWGDEQPPEWQPASEVTLPPSSATTNHN